jgi:acylphosphatase
LILKAILARVYGRVQRVGYRRFILDTAQELGLSGYVKNERDGSVTIFTQGDEIILERFIEMVKSPPAPAYVKSIDIRDAKPRPAIKYFTIKPSPLHEELQEGFGAMQSIFMEYWREFRDYRSEFRSFVDEFREFARRTDENFKMIMEKYGEISEKLTIILETLVKESRETREMLNETMKLLKEALEKLSR